MIFKPAEVGWRLGRAYEPRGGELWVPWDRTTGVIGPQGSGKTLDLLAPALLQAPGAALVTLTKVDDLLLSFASEPTEILREHPHAAPYWRYMAMSGRPAIRSPRSSRR
jgi:pantothenate kinase-related protein Tda10